MFFKKILFASVFTLGVLSSSAQAGLVGSTATLDYRWPNIDTVYTGEGLSPQTKVIVDGIDFSNSYFTVDVRNTQIVFALSNTSWNTNVSHNGPRLTFLDVPLGAVSLDVVGTSLGGNGLVLTSGSNYVDLDWKFFAGNSIVINTQQAVPEPAAYALVGIALLGAFAARKRKQ